MGSQVRKRLSHDEQRSYLNPRNRRKTAGRRRDGATSKWRPMDGGKTSSAYPFSSTRYNCCWLLSLRNIWKAAIGVRRRLKRKVNSSR